MALLDNVVFEKLCGLAKLQVSNKEEFLQKMNSVFSWIDQLSKIDTENVDLTDMSETTYERDDHPVMLNTRAEILSNTKETKFDMFSVPKIVE